MKSVDLCLRAMPRVIRYNGAKFYLTLQCQETGYSATYESVSNRGDSHVLVIDPFNLHTIAASFDYNPAKALESLYKLLNKYQDRFEVIYPDETRWRDKEEVPLFYDAIIIVAYDGDLAPEEVIPADLYKDYDTWGEYVEDHGVKAWRYKEDPLKAQRYE